MNGLILIENVLPIDTPFLKTSVVMGADPLNTTHAIVKVGTPVGGRVTFCPHVKDAKDGNVIGGNDGGIRFGSPIKGSRLYFITYNTSY